MVNAREPLETHHMQQLLLNTCQGTLTIRSIGTSISSSLSDVSGELSKNNIAGIVSLCMNMNITLAQLHESLEFFYNLSPGLMEVLSHLSKARIEDVIEI